MMSKYIEPWSRRRFCLSQRSGLPVPINKANKPCPGESKLQFGPTGMTPKIFFCSWPMLQSSKRPNRILTRLAGIPDPLLGVGTNRYSFLLATYYMTTVSQAVIYFLCPWLHHSRRLSSYHPLIICDLRDPGWGDPGFRHCDFFAWHPSVILLMLALSCCFKDDLLRTGHISCLVATFQHCFEYVIPL